MHLKVIRKIKTNKSTIGELHIDDQYFCETLEDKDRDLCTCQGLAEIVKLKVPHETAIPTGTYKVVLDMSTRFKKIMPHILEVPGFEGIRIHSGNKSEDTEGCILVGATHATNIIGDSRKIYDALMTKLQGQSEISIEII